MKIQHTLLAALGCLCLLTTPLRAQVPNLVSYQGRVAVGTPPVNFDSTTAGRPGEFKFALVTTRNSVQATATATLSISGSGAVHSITVVNGGAGYASFPVAVTITGGGGSGATAQANTSLSALGTITSVVVTNGGSGYTSPPTVVIAPPPPTYAITHWSHNGVSFAGSEPGFAPVPLQVTKGLYSVLLGDTSVPGMTQPIPTSVWSNPDVRLRVWFSDGINGFQRLDDDQRLAPYGYLPDGIVTSATLQDGAVLATKLSDGAVTSAKIASGAVTTTQLAPSLTLGGTTAGSFSGAFFGDGSGLTGVPFGSVTGNLDIPVTTSANVGVITQGGSRLIHTYGTGNFFAGRSAGNFLMTGTQNTGTGVSALSSNTFGSENTASGVQALFANVDGHSNTAYGANALQNNTGASRNVAIGAGALRNQSVKPPLSNSNNVAVGFEALYSNQPGSAQPSGADSGLNNTALGTQALYANTAGSGNTASGVFALYHNKIGISNTAIGASALVSNTHGSQSVAIGVNALSEQSYDNGSYTYDANNVAVGNSALRRTLGTPFDGSFNTAVGTEALVNNTTGQYNVALGYQAGRQFTTGNNNIALGTSAGSEVITGGNNIHIGNSGSAGDVNTIRIGVNERPTSTFIAGINGATAPSGIAVFVSSSGKLGTITSSRRFKQDIASMDGASDALLSLRPVTFRYKKDIDPQGVPQFGLIAEEVEKIAPALVVRDDKGEIQTVRYEAVNAMLLNEFLKEHRRVDAAVKTNAEQEQRLAAQAETIKAQAQAIADYEKRLAALESRDQAREARLTRLESALTAHPAGAVPASADHPLGAAHLTKGGAQ